MTNLDSILKSRDITLPTKVHLVKAMVFPVVMHGCERWTVKKAEHRRIDAFELWCWRRLLRVPWTARRSNQSILKEISPGISLEGMMLKLKLQYFGPLLRRVDSLEMTDAGRDWGQEEKGTTEDEIAGWHHQLNGCREPPREIPPMTRSCGRELLSKASELKGSLGFLEHLHQNQNLSVLLFHDFQQLL